MYNLDTNKIQISRDVVFHESLFPSLKHINSYFPLATDTSFDFPYFSSTSTHSVPLQSPLSTSLSPSTSHSSPTVHTQVPVLRRSVRTTHHPLYLDDYVCSHAMLHSPHSNIACIHDCHHTLTSSFSIPNLLCC